MTTTTDDGGTQSSSWLSPGNVLHTQTHCPWMRYGAAAKFEVAKTAPLSACNPNLTSSRMSCLRWTAVPLVQHRVVTQMPENPVQTEIFWQMIWATIGPL